MDRAIALLRLGGIMRQAIRLIKGIQIKQDQQAFEMAVFSVFAWFKVGGPVGGPVGGWVGGGGRWGSSRPGRAARSVLVPAAWTEPGALCWLGRPAQLAPGAA
jgi:hypothetical protein